MTRVIPFPRSLLPDEKYQRLLSLFGETMARLIAVENDNTTLKTNVERLAGVNVVLTCRLTEVEARHGLASPPGTDVWITVKQAAGKTGYSSSAVHKWMKAGKVATKRMGGRVLIAADSLPVSKDL